MKRSPSSLVLLVLPLLLPLLLLGAAACGGTPTCLDACENLASCGKISGTEGQCVVACEQDSSVLEEDVRCFADSSCSELSSCMPPKSTDSSPHPTFCWEMCNHIYGTCGSSLRGPDGAMDRSQCASFCRAELTKAQVGCAQRAHCSRIGSCF